MKILLLLLVLLNSSLAHASDRSFVSFENGQVQIGQSYLDLSLKNFKIIFAKNSKNIKASFIKGSLRWVRTKENIYTPQAEMVIQIKDCPHTMPYIEYQKTTHIPSYNSKKAIYTFSLSIQLFQLTHINMLKNGDVVTTIDVVAVPKKGIKSHYIDSSCTAYKLKVLNFNNQYLSMFCTLNKIGGIGNERPKLEVHWITPNYKISTKKHSPLYLTTFTKTSIANIPLSNREEKQANLKISVTLPKKLHRVKTALGLGPYPFKTSTTDSAATDAIVLNASLYGKVDLTANSSFRFFDSFSKKKESLFNNFGLYLAYDLARIYNNNIQIIALLGIQHISFKHPGESGYTYQYIAPQGAEITYKHPFGIKNYLLGGGVFFSTNDSIKYTNAWVRFGKRVMVEANYIEWGFENDYAQTYGLSVIFPLISFF